MKHFSSSLINWFETSKRDLPWRHTTDPYLIWISEVMLQQTQAVTVIPYYERFIKALPTVHDLARVEDDILFKLWEGLGYYSRAKNLKKTAKVIVDDYEGIIPNTYEQLIKLKGIGDYTASAILSIAYSKPYPAVDGNVLRVMSRYLGILDDINLPKTKKLINYELKNLIEEPTRSFTEGLIELGATVCSKSKPNCQICPIKDNCHANIRNLTDKIPYKSRLKDKKEIMMQTFILKDLKGNTILKRQEEALLNGLYLYPQVPSENINHAIDTLEETGLSILNIYKTKTYKHVFTHLIWYMDVHYGIGDVENNAYTIVEDLDLKLYPMASAHKKIKK